jgi:hypothetical protein
MKKKILFVSHKKAQCGVYEYGVNITNVLQHSKNYQYIRVECSTLDEFEKAIAENLPDAIIYNYVASVLPWIISRALPKIYRNNIAGINVPQVGIIHEITQQVADTAVSYKKKYLLGSSRFSNSLFDYYITPDPTLLLRNPCVYKTGRLIPSYQNDFKLPEIPTIGSFGFGTPKKGFEKIVQMVQQEFDEAVIRFNIPSADFGEDRQGVNARRIAENCKAMIVKPGIKLIITHDFFDNKSMLDFLAKNTLNAFLYEHDPQSDKGLSSTVDSAMAVKRPVAVSDCITFRHLFDVEPSVCVTKNSLRKIIQNGFTPLQKHYDEWNEENILWEYDRIVDSIFEKDKNPQKHGMGIIRTIQSKWNRILSKPDKTFTWLGNKDSTYEDDLTPDLSIKYRPVDIPQGISLNRILDNDARKLYKPAIDLLTIMAPKTLSRKIPEANVQQAFVLDTVHRLFTKYKSPKILCVGSNEDTTSISLKKIGYKVDEIDPTMNYYLQEYLTKPSTIRNSYDIIFSTSVIEHDPDDGSFVKCISELLAPGGTAVITCDYKDGWKFGDPKPEVDERLYTKHDLKERLLPLMKECVLVDEPQWECPDPDFNFMGKYLYTFAAFVVRKKE